jgi:hypothetical protein
MNAKQVAIENAGGDHHHERPAQEPGKRHRSADGAAQVLADIDGEIGRINAGKYLGEGKARHELCFGHPMPFVDDLAVDPGADAAAEAGKTEPKEHGVKREQRHMPLGVRHWLS